MIHRLDTNRLRGRRFLSAVLLCVVVSVLFAGTAAAQQVLPNRSPGGVIDRVLVRIDGQAILYSEFEAQWAEQLAAIATQFSQAQIDAQAPALRMRIMQGLAEGIMLELRAEDLGIAADVNEVDRAIQNMREANGLTDDVAWQTALAQNGITEAFLREEAASSIVQQRMVAQEIQRKVFVSPIEVENYYNNNIDQFTEPEQVLFQQLIFVFNGADTEPVRQRADDALRELRAGISLSAVGTKYAQPGDLVQDASEATWIAPEDLQPEILAAVNNLTPLEYSEPIQGRFGYYIIQLMDRRDGSVASLQEVGQQIDGFLRQQKMGAELETYTSELMQTASIEVFAEEFVGLRDLWMEGAEGAPTGTPGSGR